MPLEPRPDGSVDQLRLRAALNRYLLARTATDSAERHAARLDLVQVLEDAGWEPPTTVRSALLSDDRALDQVGRRTA